MLLKKWSILMLSVLFTGLIHGQTASTELFTWEDDPTDTRIYTLDNGLTVYLSKNANEPRVQTYFAVRAGSKNDPADATGLAHYLEHMLFKGTSQLGTKDWSSEQVALKEISDLYEKLRNTTDLETRDAIYKEIDAKSNAAANYAISNEYDKLVSSLGAKGTNAYTSLERTVYTNDIPANELERFLKLESDRFQELVLRLFHTELETVYEEFNRAQDNDYRKVYYSTMKTLFQNHAYGTQTTIGTGEHLKNPSMEKIHAYFNTYYRPNNCALVIVGDIDFDQTINWVEQYYGDWQPADIPEYTYTPEAPIPEPIKVERTGPDRARVMMTYRFDGYRNEDIATKMTMMDMILNNGAAGLIDLNLVQKQKVLSAGCYPSVNHDYSWHSLYGEARDGQTLEEVEQLILGEIEKIKSGQFEEWILNAIIKDMKLSRLRSYESNRGLANTMVNAFIMRDEWDSYNSRLEKMAALTKQDIVDFANTNYNNNYVVVYKRSGEDSEALRLQKPEITPIEIDRDSRSDYMTDMLNMPEKRLAPVFIDYENDIDNSTLANGLDFYSIKNENNDLFELVYTFDMGSDNDKRLALAIEYLPYIGTSKYTAEELAKEFFRLGLSYDVYAGRDRIYVSLSGLQESMQQGVELIEHVLNSVVPDQEAYDQMVDGVLKKRKDAKLDKNTILWSGLMSYAQYGENNPFTNKLSAETLKNMGPLLLTTKIKNLTNFPHEVFYYGPDAEKAGKIVAGKHKFSASSAPAIPGAEYYVEEPITETEILMVDYDMVQTQFVLLARDMGWNPALMTDAAVFREYFGSGLSSIVFQEIREAKALAYSAFATYTTPQKADRSHYVYGFVGTQTDKLPEALSYMKELMNEMPQAEKQFKAAVDAVKKKIETERITKSRKYWNMRSAKNLNMTEDRRKVIYNDLKDGYTMEELAAFFDKHISGQEYKILLIGKKENIDMEALQAIAPVREMDLETLFGY